MSETSVRIVILAAALLARSHARAFAAPTQPASGARIVVNGREVARGAAPRMVHGTLLVPLRLVGEALGASVRWDSGTQAATIRSAGRTVIARASDPTLRVNGRAVAATAPPTVIQGRLMLPLRAVGEALGATVAWDARAQTVAIHTPVAARPHALAEGTPARRRAGSAGAPLQVTLRTDKKEYRAGEPVQITLEARNAGGAPLTLQFSSGQKYDLEVRRGETPVWKWSHDRFFTQAFVQVPLAPHQSVVYHETWKQQDDQGRPVPPGDYQITGYLTTYQTPSPRDQATIRILK